MPSRARYARRIVLAATSLVAASLARRQPPVPGNAAAHQATALLLSRLPSYPDVATLTSAESALPPSLRAAVRNGSQLASVAYRDYLAFSALESLPVPAAVLAHYAPRLIAFVVPRRDRQIGIVGAAWLPMGDGFEWQSRGNVSGLCFCDRPGWAIAAGNGLAATVTSGPDAAYLGPGVPPMLANEHCLEQGRSSDGVLASLTALTPCRDASHLIYDDVEGQVVVATSGEAWKVERPGALAVVVGPHPQTAWAANAQSLRQRLEANHGWLDAAKALRLLHEAAPNADCIVLDVAARKGTISVGGSSQELRF